jgi:hypothetical protein
MNHHLSHLKAIGLFLLPSAFLILMAMALAYSDSLKLAAASPLAQATPTCPAPPAGCPQARIYGYQPWRYDMRPTFNEAASNSLGNNAPTYDKINRGIPPKKESVSASRPIPHIILRGMAWQESHWLQFANSENDPDNTYACTLVSEDCGYGLMQITSCMSDGCGWFSPIRVAGELSYNLGTGTNFLIKKWNEAPFIGDNDHTVAEQWYYAVTAYNGWSLCNDPNRSTYEPSCPRGLREPFYPDRPPYGEGDYSYFRYPYQERIWGWMAHPEIAQAGWQWLWRPTRIAPIPRGIFGLGAYWQPPSQTPKPVFHLLPNIHVANGLGPTIVLRNTTSQTLAADVALYNADHTFSRWWLGAPPNDAHSYPYRYIRLAPYETRTLPLSAVFQSSETFTGYARVIASEGVEVTLQPPPYPHKVFLPLAFRNYGGNCYNEVWNGGFEEFINGKPRYWLVSSSDGYPLADGTWFASGHYGAYLGGYDYANDVLRQYIYIPPDSLSANLTYAWYMESQEPNSDVDYDFLYIRLRDTNGNLLKELDKLSNRSPRRTWQTATFDLRSYAGRELYLSFEASNDILYPTSFFVDDVSLRICRR